MKFLQGLYIRFTDLYWWQMILWVVYLIYFIARTHAFWEETDEKGLWNGYKKVIFGYGKVFRVYHIIRILFDIPPAILGLLFPFIKKILRYEIYTFKDKTKKEIEVEEIK